MPIESFDHLWAETTFQARAVDPRLLNWLMIGLWPLDRAKAAEKVQEYFARLQVRVNA